MATPESSPRWRDEKWVHEITGIALQTLRNDRYRGRGIPFYRIGRAIRYRDADVFSWMEFRRVETTR